MNKDARRVNLIRIEFARLDDDLRFRHGDLAAGGCVRVEVARRAAIDKVAVQVGLPGFHQGQIGPDAAFQNVRDSVEILVLFAFGNHGADAGSRVKAGNARAACPHALGERSLRAELHFQFAGKELALELDILAHIAGDHLLHLVRFEQQSQAPAIHACVIAGDGQVARAGVAQGKNQRLGNAAQAETADRQQHPVSHNAVQCGGCIRP